MSRKSEIWQEVERYLDRRTRVDAAVRAGDFRKAARLEDDEAWQRKGADPETVAAIDEAMAIVSLVPSKRRAPWVSHPGQMPPAGDWRVWLMMAGRGFGKTRAGAEWVTGLAALDRTLRIALVGATADEVERVMVRGASGLMAVADPADDVIWRPSVGVVTFANGAQAFAYSGANPEALRGPEHDYAWCDELAKWAYPEETWDNLMLGLRRGARPRAVVTTTPRPIALLRRLLAETGVAVSGGRTADNPHLPPAFVDAVTARYEGTRLGRQELGGELIEEVAGALWTRALLERCRAMPPHADAVVRVVIGVDPPVSAHGDACGIVACALLVDGEARVLGDHSVGGLSPDGWARAVAAAAHAHGADRVVAEANQGGAMVTAVLQAADCALPVKLVHATRGKAARAEPVAALFEGGRVRLAAAFPELEDELCGLAIGGAYQGPGRSPDRADAMVWALTELMLGNRQGEPRIRML